MREHLINIVISETLKGDDYFQIVLLDGSVLSIYNSCLFSGVTYSDLKGCTLKAIREDEAANVIVLALDKGTLHVNVCPDAWTGPEAMVLHRPGSSIMIWS